MAADLSAAQLRAFLLVVDHGSYRAAAGRAFRSQPAISLAIRQLESRLGGVLFEPDARVRLTPFGERCVPLARELLGQHERLVESMRRLARPDQGSLAIAVLPSVASQWLPDLLNAFGARHPNVSVRVLDDNSRNIQAQVASGQVDFGICSLSDTVTDLATTALVRDDFGLVCRRDHPVARRGGPLQWRSLRGVDVLGNLTHALLAGTPAARYVESPRTFVSNMTSLVAMLERGLGVSPLPALAFPRTPGSLVFLPLVAPRVERTIGIVKPRGRSLAPVAAAMEAVVTGFFRARRTEPGARPPRADPG